MKKRISVFVLLFFGNCFAMQNREKFRKIITKDATVARVFGEKSVGNSLLEIVVEGDPIKLSMYLNDESKWIDEKTLEKAFFEAFAKDGDLVVGYDNADEDYTKIVDKLLEYVSKNSIKLSNDFFSTLIKNYSKKSCFTQIIKFLDEDKKLLQNLSLDQACVGNLLLPITLYGGSALLKALLDYADEHKIVINVQDVDNAFTQSTSIDDNQDCYFELTEYAQKHDLMLSEKCLNEILLYHLQVTLFGEDSEKHLKAFLTFINKQKSSVGSKILNKAISKVCKDFINVSLGENLCNYAVARNILITEECIIASLDYLTDEKDKGQEAENSNKNPAKFLLEYAKNKNVDISGSVVLAEFVGKVLCDASRDGDFKTICYLINYLKSITHGPLEGNQISRVIGLLATKKNGAMLNLILANVDELLDEDELSEESDVIMACSELLKGNSIHDSIKKLLKNFMWYNDIAQKIKNDEEVDYVVLHKHIKGIYRWAIKSNNVQLVKIILDGQENDEYEKVLFKKIPIQKQLDLLITYDADKALHILLPYIVNAWKNEWENSVKKEYVKIKQEKSGSEEKYKCVFIKSKFQKLEELAKKYNSFRIMKRIPEWKNGWVLIRTQLPQEIVSTILQFISPEDSSENNVITAIPGNTGNQLINVQK